LPVKIEISPQSRRARREKSFCLSGHADKQKDFWSFIQKGRSLCSNRRLPIGAQKHFLGVLCASAVNLDLKETPIDLKSQCNQLNCP